MKTKIITTRMRQGYTDTHIVHIKKWTIFGVTIFKLTYDENNKWINPLV